MSYLTCLGSVLSRRLTLASEVAPQPRLYTVLLGQSADERKSTALNKTTDLFREWYMNIERSIHAKRLEVYAMRLMSLLAANDLKSEVDAETVKKATALCDWQLEVRKTHDPIDADNKVAAMEERIRRALRKGQKRERRLQQVVNARRTGLWVYQMALKNLERHSEIAFNKVSKKWKLLS